MSFDLSATNILLAAVVAALFIAFIYVLMKLKPAAEDKQNPEPRLNVDKEKTSPPQTFQPLRSSPTSPKPMDSNSISSRSFSQTTQTPRPAPVENQPKPNIVSPPPPRAENREIPKPNKTVQAPAKAEQAPTRKDCVHFYGYLHSLSKNTPIPDECFGCVKIVDCLISPSSTTNGADSNQDLNHNSKKRGWL